MLHKDNNDTTYFSKQHFFSNSARDFREFNARAKQ